MKFQLLIETRMLKIKTVLAFRLSDIVIIMLINVKMPTIIDILVFKFLSMINLSCVEHEKSFITLMSAYLYPGSVVFSGII